MLYSNKLAQLAKDATIGMSEKEVTQKTGLSKAAYYRIKGGEVVSKGLLTKFAVGLEIPVKAVFDAAADESGPAYSGMDVVQAGLEMSDVLTPSDRVELMRHYRELMERRQGSSERESRNAA